MSIEGQSFKELRNLLVENVLIPSGIDDKQVLEAFRKVPRHKFVPQKRQTQAYEDSPLDIGEGQVITQPSLAAAMTQAAQINSSDKLLEIGTGSGYQAAILAELADHVYTIERFETLANRASKTFETLGYNNVNVIIGDGSKGLPEEAPFDVIMVTAASPSTPPKPLLDQLKLGGRLIIPIGDRRSHEVYIYNKISDENFERHRIIGARFVPLVGEYGFPNQ